MMRLILTFTALVLPLLANAQMRSEYTRMLEKTDKLRTLTEAMNTTWSDSNISTGRSNVAARLLKIETPKTWGQWRELSEGIFAENFKYYENEKLPSNVVFETTAKGFEDYDVELLVEALAKSNDYNRGNSAIMNSLRRQAWVLVRKLGVEDDTKVLISTDRIKRENDEDAVTITNFIIVNPSSGRLISAYFVEGTV